MKCGHIAPMFFRHMWQLDPRSDSRNLISVVLFTSAVAAGERKSAADQALLIGGVRRNSSGNLGDVHGDAPRLVLGSFAAERRPASCSTIEIAERLSVRVADNVAGIVVVLNRTRWWKQGMGCKIMRPFPLCAESGRQPS